VAQPPKNEKIALWLATHSVEKLILVLAPYAIDSWLQKLSTTDLLLYTVGGQPECDFCILGRSLYTSLRRRVVWWSPPQTILIKSAPQTSKWSLRRRLYLLVADLYDIHVLVCLCVTSTTAQTRMTKTVVRDKLRSLRRRLYLLVSIGGVWGCSYLSGNCDAGLRRRLYLLVCICVCVCERHSQKSALNHLCPDWIIY